MSKPIKCPSCNVNMDILSNLVSGEDDLYSAKVECPSCLTRITPVLASTETRARRLAAHKCRAWIAKLKTCDQADNCAFKLVEDVFPAPPRAPGSGSRPYGAPWMTPVYAAQMPDDVVIYGCGMPDTVVMYMASDPAVVYEHIPATVTVTKITPEDLINGSVVTTAYADSTNITPVYSAPGNKE
jgi:hypothetical protein